MMGHKLHLIVLSLMLNKTSLAQIEEEDRLRKAESHRRTFAKYEGI